MSDSADFVRAARKKLGLSQRAFAKKLGVGQATIPRYESAGYPLTRPMRLAIMQLLEEHKREGKGK